MPDTRPTIAVELTADRSPVHFTAEQFALMARAGVFDGPNGKPELVRGILYSVEARFAPHARSLEQLAFILESMFGEASAHCVARTPRIALGAETVMAPHLAILKRAEAGDEVLRADAVELAIEIADNAGGDSLAARLAVYAAADVPRVWVLETAAARVDVHSAPGPDGYGAHRAFAFGEPVPLAPLADAQIVIPAGGFE